MTKTDFDFWRQLLFCCEWVAVFAGIAAWRQVKNTRYRYFVAYLLFIAAGEIVAYYAHHHNQKPLTIFLGNWVLIPAQFLFFYWFYYRSLTKTLHKAYCVAFAIGSVLFRVMEYTVWSNEKFSFSSLSYLISSVFLITLIMMYLAQFIRSDDIIHYHRHFDFWVTLGLLVFYLGSFPLFAFYNYLYSVNKPFFYGYWKIQMVLNMLMYLIFSFAFIWTGIKQKYSYYS
jgi:hypothetical protein